MGYARIPLVSYGGVSLQTSTFTCFGGRELIRLQTGAWEPTWAELANAWPVMQGQARKSRTENVTFELVGTGATHELALAQVRALMQPERNRSPKTLIVTIEGVNYEARALFRGIVPHESNLRRGVVTARIEIVDQLWHASSASSVTGTNVSVTGGGVSWTNVGNAAGRRWQITLAVNTAKTAANGQKYRRMVNLVPTQPRDAAQHPIELTGGGWNTAALVSGGKMQSDGDDLTLLVNGVPWPRYFAVGTGAVNQTTTKVWTYLDLPAARTWTITTAITAGSTSFVAREMIGSTPPVPFRVKMEDEVAWVTDVDSATGIVTLGTRGLRGTSAASHAAGVKAYWMPYTIDLVYGWTSAPTPRWTDDLRPIPAESADSGNDEWYFAVYQQVRTSGQVMDRLPRPGSWRAARRPYPDWTQRDDLYVNWIPWTAGRGSDAASATSIAIAYNQAGAKLGHPLVDRWEWRSGIGVDRVKATPLTATMTHDSPDPSEGKLQLVATGIDGQEVVLDTYDGFDYAEQTLSPAVPLLYLAFVVKPWDREDLLDNTNGSESSIPLEPDDGDGFAISAGARVRFVSTERVDLDFAAEEAIYQFGRPDDPAYLIDEDGNALYLDGVVMATSDTLTLDRDEMTATLGDGTSVAHLVRGLADLTIPADEAARPHASDLQYVETGIGTIVLGVPSYRSAWY